MILGGHVSASGGISRAIQRAVDLEFQCFQIHPSSPTTWAGPKAGPEEITAFRTGLAANALSAFFHSIYLINLASEDPNIWNRSLTSLQEYLTLAAASGTVGAITHLGSHRGAGTTAVLPRVSEGIRSVLDQTPPGAFLIIENTAGAGGTLGRTLEEIEQLIEPLVAYRNRLAICIDSCHAFAAGIPVHTPEGAEQFLTEFAQRFGLEMLVAIHLNDSKFPFGSNRDRHANIGEGEIGAGLHPLLTHPTLQSTPFLMEVPGIDGTGPDAVNRDRVRALIAPKTA